MATIRSSPTNKRLVRRDFKQPDYAETAEFYHKIHKHFDLSSAGLRYVLQVIANRVPADKINQATVLDAGCGFQARVIRLLQEQYTPHQIVGLDVNPNNIAHCQSLGMDRVSFQVSDLDTAPLGRDKYDFICCEGVLMYCREPMEVLGKMVSAAKPGGYILLGIYCWRPPYSVFSRALRSCGRLIDKQKLFSRLSGRHYTLINLLDLLLVPVEKYFDKDLFVSGLERRGDLRFVSCDLAPSFFPFKKGSRVVTRMVGNCYYHIVARKL
jgi:SAM-dependent methyltransferase